MYVCAEVRARVRVCVRCVHVRVHVRLCLPVRARVCERVHVRGGLPCLIN